MVSEGPSPSSCQIPDTSGLSNDPPPNPWADPRHLSGRLSAETSWAALRRPHGPLRPHGRLRRAPGRLRGHHEGSADPPEKAPRPWAALPGCAPDAPNLDNLQGLCDLVLGQAYADRCLTTTWAARRRCAPKRRPPPQTPMDTQRRRPAAGAIHRERNAAACAPATTISHRLAPPPALRTSFSAATVIATAPWATPGRDHAGLPQCPLEPRRGHPRERPHPVPARKHATKLRRRGMAWPGLAARREPICARPHGPWSKRRTPRDGPCVAQPRHGFRLWAGRPPLPRMVHEPHTFRVGGCGVMIVAELTRR